MRRDGFTLIELLVVIAIIAILAAILFPILVMAKEAGKRTKCMSNQRQIVMAMLSYADDHYGKLPALNAFSKDLYEPKGDFMTGALSKYLGRAKGLMVCPSDLNRLNQPGVFFHSHTINGWITWAAHPDMAPVGTDARRLADEDGFHMSYFAQPRKTIAIVDENTDLSVHNYIVNDQLFIWYDWTGNKHNGKANVAYLDGHTGQVKAFLEWNTAKYPDGSYIFQQ